MVLRTIGPRITGPWDLGCLGSKVRGPKVRGSKALGLIILEPSAGQLVVHCGQGKATQGKAAAGQLGKRQESCDTAVSSFSPLTPSPLRACRYCSYAKQ